jgi:hypothetical protein
MKLWTLPEHQQAEVSARFEPKVVSKDPTAVQAPLYCDIKAICFFCFIPGQPSAGKPANTKTQEHTDIQAQARCMYYHEAVKRD